MKFQTRCVHEGVNKDAAYNSATTPIYPTSTFRWDDLRTNRGFDYTRSGNPTRAALEENIASLEGGIGCRATCTGMAAITAVMHLFEPGDHIIAGHDIYGGTYRLFADVFTRMGLMFSFVNMGNPKNVQSAVTPETKGIWIETPSNPLLNIVEILTITKIAKEQGAISIADNTFLSPYLQRPFEHGVDVVIHSTTKYLNGHSDVVGGCVVTKEQEHAERVAYIVNALGLGCSPFDAWLVLRGIKTLGPANGGPSAGGDGGRPDARGTSPGRSRLLSRFGIASPVRTRQAPAGRLRGDAEFRCEGRRGVRRAGLGAV